MPVRRSWPRSTTSSQPSCATAVRRAATSASSAASSRCPASWVARFAGGSSAIRAGGRGGLLVRRRRRRSGPWLKEERAATAPTRAGRASNELIAYHAPIARALTDERTSLESRLIPVSAYIVTACIEAFLRYPEMMAAIDAALPADEIGRRARRPGCRDQHRLALVDRQLLAAGPQGHGAWSTRPRPTTSMPPTPCSTSGSEPPRASGATAPGRRGTRGAAPVYDAGGGRVSCSTEPHRSATTTGAALKRFNATLIAYLFLLYFDTRVGAGDTGPVPRSPTAGCCWCGTTTSWPTATSGGRTWPRASPTATSPPRWCSTASRIDRMTDFGTSYTTPEDYLDHLVALRALHHRRRGARRAARRCRSTSSRPDRRRGPPGAVRACTAASRPWTGTRRSAAGRTSTSPSCGPSRPRPASPSSWTGPCRGTSPARSTSWCRPWRATTPASTTMGPYYAPLA